MQNHVLYSLEIAAKPNSIRDDRHKTFMKDLKVLGGKYDLSRVSRSVAFVQIFLTKQSVRFEYLEMLSIYFAEKGCSVLIFKSAELIREKTSLRQSKAPQTAEQREHRSS